MSERPIRAGDHVYHRPTGETWVVMAVDHESGTVRWAGWPPGCADIADCERVYEATDREHAGMIAYHLCHHIQSAMIERER
ncbi:MAG TPA: hypothetical protein PK478_01925 [Nitrospira sp.]|nr:hypothetical protein [Nitrospira sp.]HQW88575.1 hypothetical protein [Nitrospira sp.]